MNKFYMDDVQWKLPQLFYFMRHHFRRPQAIFNKGSLFYSHCVFYYITRQYTDSLCIISLWSMAAALRSICSHFRCQSHSHVYFMKRRFELWFEEQQKSCLFLLLCCLAVCNCQILCITIPPRRDSICEIDSSMLYIQLESQHSDYRTVSPY
jgi:hypothetical protein